MNITKTLIATAALACFSVGASAMQPLAEEQLSEVTGQAISIFGNLDVNIGSVVYTDTNAGNGGSFTASDIDATGVIAATLDLKTAANAIGEFVSILGGTANATIVLGAEAGFGSVSGTAFSTGFYDGSDVVRIAVPNLGIADGDAILLDVSIGDMSMGNSTKSYGSLAINDINLQGTVVYIWAH